MPCNRNLLGILRIMPFWNVYTIQLHFTLYYKMHCFCFSWLTHRYCECYSQINTYCWFLNEFWLTFHHAIIIYWARSLDNMDIECGRKEQEHCSYSHKRVSCTTYNVHVHGSVDFLELRIQLIDRVFNLIHQCVVSIVLSIQNST